VQRRESIVRLFLALRAFGRNEIAALKRRSGMGAACANATGTRRPLGSFLPSALKWIDLRSVWSSLEHVGNLSAELASLGISYYDKVCLFMVDFDFSPTRAFGFSAHA
jgi:hypothetical protein